MVLIDRHNAIVGSDFYGKDRLLIGGKGLEVVIDRLGGIIEDLLGGHG